MTNPVHPKYQCIVASPWSDGHTLTTSDAIVDTMAKALSMDRRLDRLHDNWYWDHGEHSLVADSACMWLWVADSTRLVSGLRVLKELDFHYVRTLVWVHDADVPGGIELCLLGTHQAASTATPLYGPSVEFAPRTHPSAKPQKFYDRFREDSPGPYLEMFTQGKREGWDAWAPTPPPPATEAAS